jgi:acetyltransferase-like isoleucine patch superfamily enzyme
MKREGRVTSDHYVDVDYHQFTPSAGLRIGMRVAGVLTWPATVPLALLSRASDFVFRTVSELLAIVPFLFGTIVRQEFYRFALRRCGDNVSIGFGTVLIYRDIEIGDNVLIGMHNTVHYCDFGSYVLIAEGCAFLSGAKYHNYQTRDRPMALQGGKLRRIRVGDDCWVGANATVMDDLGDGCIVGAGSVVTAAVEPYGIVAGNPARLVRSRP